jgi:hypothetical protein
MITADTESEGIIKCLNQKLTLRNLISTSNSDSKKVAANQERANIGDITTKVSTVPLAYRIVYASIVMIQLCIHTSLQQIQQTQSLVIIQNASNTEHIFREIPSHSQ